ncbi:alpha/beta fold hydrolase [Commensalibacter oyaizuii]|uniref:Alpha/beta fold hydrolase n=1 Tax=Commensalibacter oyaizuii TaxID=3043873 RepID=A0ABT6PZF1_9PROT|nr:alpha/beta fold hydrolase [Commensalibacter sp. TBRC 16381]MDI2090231.1 alpha/beta fold hydrolase [Commensalibacter sp. TBRC 16381]
MTSKPQLLFVHGWGFSKEFWNKILPYCSNYKIHLLDIGFISNQPTSEQELHSFISHQDHIVAVGHSLGFLYLLKQFPHRFKHYIAINSFARFSKTENFIHGIPTRILDRMSKGLEQPKTETLSQFYQQCGYTPSSSIKDINIPLLQLGLKWLKTEDVSHIIPLISDKLTVISSTNDPVIPQAMTTASFPTQHIHWVDSHTHLLPITHPKLCVTLIQQNAML